MPEYTAQAGDDAKPFAFLAESGLAASRGEARRLIKQARSPSTARKSMTPKRPCRPVSMSLSWGKSDS